MSVVWSAYLTRRPNVVRVSAITDRLLQADIVDRDKNGSCALRERMQWMGIAHIRDRCRVPGV